MVDEIEKSKLRKMMKEALGQLSPSLKSIKSQSVVSQLFSTIQKFPVVGVYHPIQNEEVDWRGLKSLAKFQYAYPFINVDMSMEFKICEEVELTPSELSPKLLIPPKSKPTVKPDVLIIPGLAFDQRGSRLGRGKGFYDRYLEHFNGIKIGVCFDEQFVNYVPTMSHDYSMDIVITDKRHLHISEKK